MAIRSLIFLGNEPISWYSFKRIYDMYRCGDIGHLAAVCPPAVGSDAGPVRRFCTRNGIEVYEPEDRNTLKGWAPPSGFDVAVVVSFRYFLPPRVINAFGRTINMHPSSLPRHRGAAPLQASLLAGDSVSSVSVIKICPGEPMDSGDVLYNAEYAVPPYVRSVHALLPIAGELGASCVEHVLRNIEVAWDGAASQAEIAAAATDGAVIVTRPAMCAAVQREALERGALGVLSPWMPFDYVARARSLGLTEPLVFSPLHGRVTYSPKLPATCHHLVLRNDCRASGNPPPHPAAPSDAAGGRHAAVDPLGTDGARALPPLSHEVLFPAPSFSLVDCQSRISSPSSTSPSFKDPGPFEHPLACARDYLRRLAILTYPEAFLPLHPEIHPQSQAHPDSVFVRFHVHGALHASEVPAVLTQHLPRRSLRRLGHDSCDMHSETLPCGLYDDLLLLPGCVYIPDGDANVAFLYVGVCGLSTCCSSSKSEGWIAFSYVTLTWGTKYKTFNIQELIAGFPHTYARNAVTPSVVPRPGGPLGSSRPQPFPLPRLQALYPVSEGQNVQSYAPAWPCNRREAVTSAWL